MQNSNELSARALECLPSGVTHDMRWRIPSGPYFTSGKGAHKQTVDGDDFIDYVQGHGALLYGIADDQVNAAVSKAVSGGSHLGGNHPAEVRWAELVCDMVPSAEVVRFTASGTEASLLAMRLARIATGRDKIVKLAGHFNGWHDYATIGINPPFDKPVSPGVPQAVLSTVDVLDSEPDLVEARLAIGDVAGLILEPSGAGWGTVEIPYDDLARFADSCRRFGTVLIFDEVISGFRVSPGGIQFLSDVLPDLTLLGKILAGGLPGGAVAGRSELFEPLTLRESGNWNRFGHLYHPGTFNANPLSAAAGVATLTRIREESPIGLIDDSADKFRRGLAAELARAGIPASVYGRSSWFHLHLGEGAVPPSDAATAKTSSAAGTQLDRALVDRGIDTIRLGGFLGTCHGPGEIARTIESYLDAISKINWGT